MLATLINNTVTVTATGSFFASCQSAGAAGLSTGAAAGVFGTTAAATGVVGVSGCAVADAVNGSSKQQVSEEAEDIGIGLLCRDEVALVGRYPFRKKVNRVRVVRVSCVVGASRQPYASEVMIVTDSASSRLVQVTLLDVSVATCNIDSVTLGLCRKLRSFLLLGQLC